MFCRLVLCLFYLFLIDSNRNIFSVLHKFLLKIWVESCCYFTAQQTFELYFVLGNILTYKTSSVWRALHWTQYKQAKNNSSFPFLYKGQRHIGVCINLSSIFIYDGLALFSLNAVPFSKVTAIGLLQLNNIQSF